MAEPNMTDILGIQIPSTDPVFLTIVGFHILIGLACVISGAVAIFSRKGRGRHSRFGALYFWLLAVLFGSASILSLMRWTDDYHLFILGLLSFMSAIFGRSAARGHWRRWPRLHLTGMGLSYIVMLTAFLVDNGKFLPVWRELPPHALWFVPSLIGLPFLIHALLRHPVVIGYDRLRSAQTIQADRSRPGIC
jgi:cell division protein FtsW (lipid II flippase)